MSGKREVISNQVIMLRFMEHLKGAGKREQTIRAYRSDVRHFLDSLVAGGEAENPARITREAITKCIAGRANQELSPSTRKRRAAGLRSFHRFLIQEGLLPSEEKACSRLPVPRSGPVNADQIIAAFKTLRREPASSTVLSHRDELLFALMVIYGMRPSRLMELRLKDFRRAGDQVILGTGKDHSIFLDRTLLLRLHTYLKEREEKPPFLFADGTDRISARTINDLLARIASSAGFPISAERLRHASALLRSQGDELNRVYNAFSAGGDGEVMS